MGSSGGSSDYEAPPQGPAPPANMIAPQGQSAPFSPHFINFLGDTNQPSTGLTPDMLAQISAANGPPPSAPPGAGGLTSGTDIELNKLRDQLAALTAAKPTPPTQADLWQQQRNDRGGPGSGHGAGGGMGGGWGGH